MSHKGEFVKATNIETSEVKFYKNGMDASRGIGCSHVLAYKVSFKKEIEDRILNLRQSLVDYAHD